MTAAGSSPGPGLPVFPVFFLSYAGLAGTSPDSEDDNAFFVQFFEAVSSAAAERLGVPAGGGIGFMPGPATSSAAAARALSVCQVFVPLWSPRYFKTERCGREWSAFLSRSPHRPVPPESFAPVTWAPVPPSMIPEAALAADGGRRREDRPDADKGLYALMNDDEHESYLLVVEGVADAIVAAAWNPRLPRVGVDPDWEDSAFVPRTTPLRLRIVLLAPTLDDLPPGRTDAEGRYGPRLLDWSPFGEESGQPLAEEVQEQASSRLGYEADVVAFDDVAESLFADRPPGDDVATLLLIDNWALLDARRRRQVERYARLDRRWYRFMVVRNDWDPETRQRVGDLRDAVGATLGRYLGDMRIDLAQGAAGESGDRFRDDFSLLAQAAALGYVSR